jgi:hypothetical protein
MDKDKITRTIISAQPSWFVVRFLRGGKEGDESWDDSLKLEEILAWSIEVRETTLDPRLNISRYETHVSYHCIPLTTDGAANNISNPWAIKSPQGKYEIPYMGWYDTEDEVLKALKEEDDEDQRQRERHAGADPGRTRRATPIQDFMTRVLNRKK